MKSTESKINLWEIEISPDGTHHIYKGKPLYNKRFIHVMSFHYPGVAAVIDESGAYHINLNGEPIYPQRYIKTYGYYEGIATVVDGKGYTHIDLRGKPIHNKHFAWAGNFQNGRCVVRDWNGEYYHIKRNGEPAYKERYAYAGDYRNGVAVVYDFDGYAYHIDKNGKIMHGGKFLELYPYHKGIAIARDEYGYFHIDINGRPLYNKRYKLVENYYNDYALAWDFDGRMLIIDKKGNIVHTITDYSSNSVKHSLRKKLMNMMIGYWYTQIIYSIVKLDIIDLILKGYDTFEKLRDKLDMKPQCLKMIIDFLKVYGFITSSHNGKLQATELGLLLSDKNPYTLKYAALMWGEEHYMVMSSLYTALKNCKEAFSTIYGKNYYHYLRSNPNKMDIFIKAMKAYTIDYDELIPKMKIPSSTRILADIGGGHGELLRKILKQYPYISKGILFDLPETVAHIKTSLPSNIDVVQGDFLDEISLRNIDAAILARVLHDWPDRAVHRILCNVNNILRQNGLLYIFEILYPSKPVFDLGVTLNFNQLVMLEGRERTLNEYRELLCKAGFVVKDIIPGKTVSLIIAIKIRNCENNTKYYKGKMSHRLDI